jgi:hypothetical protein
MAIQPIIHGTYAPNYESIHLGMSRMPKGTLVYPGLFEGVTQRESTIRQTIASALLDGTTYWVSLLRSFPGGFEISARRACEYWMVDTGRQIWQLVYTGSCGWTPADMPLALERLSKRELGDRRPDRYLGPYHQALLYPGCRLWKRTLEELEAALIAHPVPIPT